MNNYNFKRAYLAENADAKLRTGNPLQVISKTVKTWTPNTRTRKTVSNFLPEKISINRILSSLSERAISRLFPFLEKSTVSTGEYIHQSGDNLSYIYFPETAILSEYQMLEDGRTIELTMTGREGVMGLSAIFGSPTAPNWTQALIGGSLIKINTHILQQEFNRCGVLHSLFLGFVNDYVKRISQRVICNNHHLIEGRLCSWLLTLGDRHKSDVLPITQEQIAYFLGVHRPTITLVAQNLRARKIIDYVRGHISILDRQALENSACSCYPVTKVI